MLPFRQQRLAAVWAVALWLAAAHAEGCSIPVFRYALERWQSDPYEVLIYHRGELTPADAELLDRLHPEPIPGEPRPNTALVRVNLAGTVRPEFAAIWEDDGGGAVVPWVVVRTPWRGENFTVWNGPLSSESVDEILASPHRAELIRRLAGGDSIVWVFLDGNDAERSERLAAAAETQLRALQSSIVLPEIRPEDLASLSVDPDSLGLRFSFLRIAHDISGESLLVRSLLAVRPGLTDAWTAGEPMLFPIFGRGRVFFPVVGDDIQPINIEDQARFLCGACQCTVKEQHPGVDLLTNVDWDAYVLGLPTEKPLPPLAGLGGFALVHAAGDGTNPESPVLPPLAGETVSTEATPTAPEIPPQSSAAATAPTSTRQTDYDPGGLAVWMLGLLTAVVAVASLWLRPRN